MTAVHPPGDTRAGGPPTTRGEYRPAQPTGAVRGARPGPGHCATGPDDAEARGGYVLAEASAERPDALLVAAGGDEPVALAARRILEAESIGTRVVAMPRPDRFAQQDQEYQDTVLPPDTPVRVSVEAGAALGWYALLSDAGRTVGIDEFGYRAPGESLSRHCGLTPERVAAAVRAGLARARRKAA
ncbi:transketolase-like TK C-terminal-containing protein [Streptomyces acidicola]|uniref:Transketolase-like C-terminal domain-containing protein n=1 Tax=Streptomyces acidicola TaxID=2596892 RepID=A0A5N8WTS8_9ACTN|nr:transketolase C-terminal domain-containing protein [Streptomyces acidicola]MPY49948.1 hypothetical protein [Streptomyces acidicola]